MLDLEHRLNRDSETNIDINFDRNLESRIENDHQIVTIDEFSVARINRLWDNWLQGKPRESRNKHEFYRSEVCDAHGLEGVRLATVYVLLARLDAKRQRDAQQVSSHLPDAGAEAGPV